MLFAERAHEGQSRLNGDRYIEHPRVGALELSLLGLGDPHQREMLVHDVPESVKTADEREQVYAELAEIGMPKGEIADLQVLTNTYTKPWMTPLQRHQVYLSKYIPNLIENGSNTALAVKGVDQKRNAFDQPFGPQTIIAKPSKNLTGIRQIAGMCMVLGEIEKRASMSPENTPELVVIEHLRLVVAKAHLEIIGSPLKDEEHVPINYTFTEMASDIAQKITT